MKQIFCTWKNSSLKLFKLCIIASITVGYLQAGHGCGLCQLPTPEPLYIPYAQHMLSFTLCND